LLSKLLLSTLKPLVFIGEECLGDQGWK